MRAARAGAQRSASGAEHGGSRRCFAAGHAFQVACAPSEAGALEVRERLTRARKHARALLVIAHP
jgi:hypothetical protein